MSVIRKVPAEFYTRHIMFKVICPASTYVGITDKGQRIKRAQDLILCTHDTNQILITLQDSLFDAYINDYVQIKASTSFGEQFLVSGQIVNTEYWDLGRSWCNSFYVDPRDVPVTKQTLLNQLINWECLLSKDASCREAYHDWLIDQGFHAAAQELLPSHYLHA